MKDIASVVAEVCQSLFNVEVEVVLTRPDEQFGDLAANVALQMSKAIGKNPREIAQAIASALPAKSDVIAEVNVAGPGFINIRLTDSSLLNGLVTRPVSTTMTGQTVLLEYSDPNALKPLHAGHLYTTLVGDVIARLVERTGANVTRINYGGDVGLHVGKSMWAIVQDLGGEFPEKLADIPEADRAKWLGARYAAGHAAYEDDETARTEIITANKRAYQVHSTNDHESTFAQIYWTCREWSYAYFRRLYQELQVKPFDRFIPESEVAARGFETVREQLGHGVYKESDGAVVFEGEPYGLHTRVFINAQGIPTYEAKDVGLLLTKWDDYHFDRSIVITANEQSEYFKVMLASVAQFAPEPAERSVHITHGVVKLQGGVKMSSRKGNVVSALEIIDAAREAAAELGVTANDDTVLAAIKYAFAKNRIGGDIAYDPKESIALEGNSGPYLQYAHARARSILQKADGKITPSLPSHLDADERTLVRLMTQYDDAVQRAMLELLPHHICGYLYELSQAFNRFYEKNRVIGDPRAAERLQLVQWYADILKDGLGLLGIAAPDHM